MALNRFVVGTSSFSWIDPKTGLPEVDKAGAPPASLGVSTILGRAGYRFSNFLEAVLDIDDRIGITRAEFSDKAGMYRSPSFLKLPSAEVGHIGRTVCSRSYDAVTFRQVVGCRTESPEIIGSGLGSMAGAAAGYAGVTLLAPPAGITLLLASLGCGVLGYFSGREAAEYFSAFPPIWTELELTVRKDRSVSCSLVSHSLFPSVTLYVSPAYNPAGAPALYKQQGLSYDGTPERLKRWKDRGWGLANQRRGPSEGSPWGMADPRRVIGPSRLQYEQPKGY